jgi:hypothetical protein
MRRQGEDVTFNTSKSVYSLGLSNFEFRKNMSLFHMLIKCIETNFPQHKATVRGLNSRYSWSLLH